MENEKMKLFMCCHKQPEYVPKMCTPILCGSALTDSIPDILSDIGSSGSISEKNREYCELTAHYYAWKNVDADYYGFCHYRRFFLFGKQTKHPYIVKKSYAAAESAGLFSDTKTAVDTVLSFDIIAPRKENMGISAREHYSTASGHRGEDLELFLEILKRRAPELSDSAEKYLSGNCQYFCNMFIMKRLYFQEYCRVLFGILEEFDERRSDRERMGQSRTDGYLGEIFTGIFITDAAYKGLSVCELPRLDITSDRKKLISAMLFPPESPARFAAKKIYKLISKEKK